MNLDHCQPVITAVVSMVFQLIDSSSSFQWQISTRTPSKSNTTGQSANHSSSGLGEQWNSGWR